ncbi:GNAT superfamily N-acetyltransferase [Granulicella aggregans]|jgi:GNAT superfamily N-acetyltransferase|uniref:GNAT superfamily N-acetyltransferase n=1 Tax=Granulicella aggregans TaxID=474949 RepID=A0A7W7Z993_9BACT|nr:GNAT family N-acetyltransferase [Granulicella aggregans]MBB5055643.1 GNAT superfamily N-acetyltransferase [Granulicella aggregans]
MDGLAIREAVASDVAAMLKLYELGDRASDEAFTLDEGVAHLEMMQRNPALRVYVACDGDVVVGTYELLIMENMAKRGRRSGIVEDVMVLPEYRGRGVGKAMMQDAMDRCSAAGCYKLTLSSNRMREGAHRFYDALGFTRHGYSFRVELD